MWNYTWPILLVILSNSVYHICAKSTPQSIHPFISLTLTYFIAGVSSLLLYFSTRNTETILGELKKANWASIVLGLAVVGLEVGYIYVYRAGWNISIGSLVANIGLALVLVAVGVGFYKEVITVSQIIGIFFCILGIAFINK